MGKQVTHHLRLGLVILLACVAIHPSQAQDLYISRYIGFNYLADPIYEVDLFNATDQPVSLSNYLLVSRQFVAKLPTGTRIPAYSRLSMGKHSAQVLDLPFDKIEDFIIRIPKENEPGDYLILFDEKGAVVDAFYYGPRREVRFLPDQGELVTFQHDPIPFEVPDESQSLWNYLQMAPDPALAFMRVNSRWEISSRKRNSLPATAFGELKAKYVQGIVTINAVSRFERDCLPHQLERSEDGLNFEMIHRLDAVQNAEEATNYRYYDSKIEPDRRYIYRLKNEDKFGFVIYSNLVEVRTDDLPGDFAMDVFQTPANGYLNIRFSTRQARQVRIKILDEQFRELDLLFYNKLTENSRHLIKYEETLPPGKYLIIADVGKRRVFETVIISQ